MTIALVTLVKVLKCVSESGVIITKKKVKICIFKTKFLLMKFLTIVPRTLVKNTYFL